METDIESLQSTLPGYGTSSISGSTMNLTNAQMGTGIVCLPLALHLCGFWVGIICSILIAYLTCMAMHLTVICGIKSNRYSLGELCEILLGSYGYKLCNLVLIFHTTITAISYYIMLGDTLPMLFHHYIPQLTWLSNRQLVVTAFGLLICLPLSSSRSPSKLANWSTVSVLIIPLMIIGVMIRLPVYLPPFNQLELEIEPFSMNTIKGIAIMALSFGCSQNVFGIYLSTENQKTSSWLLISSLSTSISYLLNFLFATMGYICFGKHVQANVLLNFPEDDTAINVVRLALGLFMSLTIPLTSYPCRDSLETLLEKNTNGRIASDKEHRIITFLLFIPTLYFGATLTSLGSVVDIIGGFSTMILGFFLPGIVFIRLFIKSNDEERKPLLENKLILLDWSHFIIACGLVIVSIPIIYVTIIDHL
ncbi:unnamed protein product [Cunninghamella echinulata]